MGLDAILAIGPRVSCIFLFAFSLQLPEEAVQVSSPKRRRLEGGEGGNLTVDTSIPNVSLDTASLRPCATSSAVRYALPFFQIWVIFPIRPIKLNHNRLFTNFIF